MYVDLILRWMHILSAITLVGGAIFLRLAFYSDDATEEQKQFAAAVRGRWAKVVGAMSGMLMVSGLMNLVRILGGYEIVGDTFPGSVYHMVFGIKFLLAFGVFFLSATLAGKRSLAERLRQNEKKWLTINAVLAVAVVLLAGVMKLADRTPKAEEPAESAALVSATQEC